MRAMGKNSDAKSRKVTPPGPAYMSNDQFASYLSELRSNRVARPGGARPQPSGARPPPGRSLTNRSSTGRFSPDSQAESLPAIERTPSHVSSIAAGSIASRYSSVTGRSQRDYYPASSSTSVPLKPSEVVPSSKYMERGQRWMEKEEATSLRDAMEELDLRQQHKEASQGTLNGDPEEETRVYEAALDEAAELVWQHQNGGPKPRPDGPYRYRPHLRKNSYAHARTASVDSNGQSFTQKSRSVSGSSTDSDDGSRQNRTSMEQGEESGRSRSKYGSVGRPGQFSERRRTSAKRNISGEIGRPFTEDQIWEEPEAMQSGDGGSSGRASPEKLSDKATNPLNRVRFEPVQEEPGTPKSLNRVEIYRNPPTKSRNPDYTINPDTPPRADDKVERINGMEVRGQDIREATSMRLKDRSPKLPEPTAVSDSPGRPIVSFDAKWRAPDESTDAHPDRTNPPAPAPVPARTYIPYYPGAQLVEVPGVAVAEEGTAKSRASVPSVAVDAGEERRRELPSINVPSINIAPSEERGRFSERPRDLPTVNVPSISKAASEERGRFSERPRDLPTVNVPSNNIAPSEDRGRFSERPRDLPTVNVPSISVAAPESRPRDLPTFNVPSICVASASEDRPRAKGRSRDLPTVNVPSISVAAPERKPRDLPPTNAPSISVAAPGGRARDLPKIDVPTIAVDEAPSGPSIPVIATPDDKPTRDSRSGSSRPLPTPAARGQARPLPQPRGHWSPASGAASRTATTCHECRFPIEGRFVSLAGGPERFHPYCFSCYTCGTNLQAMEISPEPDHVREERISRIRRRAAGEMLDEQPGMTMAEDGDERLRFFCHLDWHEQFAPRCKHCTTPIMGEHIVALGEHWHYGHFFCAECGDPFEHGMTHIEKDGYAWCVNCQTKRTERRAPKCRKCNVAVIGQYIQALGGEWHEHCFRCAECEGGFDDGQIFTKIVPQGTIVLCTGCRAMELKA